VGPWQFNLGGKIPALELDAETTKQLPHSD
jgi:hypothetical protein